MVANRDAAGTDAPGYERWDAGGAEWLRDDGRQLRLAFALDPVPTRADVWVLQSGAPPAHSPARPATCHWNRLAGNTFSSCVR